MKLWVSKNYWWAVPGFGFLALLVLAYVMNFSTEYEYEAFVRALVLSLISFVSLIFLGIIGLVARNTGSKTRQFFLFISASLTAAFLLAPAWGFVSYLSPQRPPSHSYELPFSPELWDIDNYFETLRSDTKLTNRRKMMGNLIDEILPEKKMKFVLEILGPDESLQPKPNSLTYLIGPARYGGSMYDYLRLNFNETGLFTEWQIFSD